MTIFLALAKASSLAFLKPGQHLPAVAGLYHAGHGLSGHAGVIEPPGNLLGVLDRGAEDDGPLVLYILEPGIYNKLIALRHIDLALQIPDVVLNAVEPHFGQVDVGVDADAAHRHQLTDFHSGLDVQLVAVFLKMSRMFLSSARSGVAVRPRVNSGVK